MMSSQATVRLICALNNPHNTLQGQLQIAFYASCMTWLVSYVGSSPPPGRSCQEKEETLRQTATKFSAF